MTEILFYHLERQPLEQILPQLLRKTLERGWKAVVRVGSEERAEALAGQLWSFDEESFLPHGTRLDGFAESQPVWITAGDDRPNGAEVAFLADGAEAGTLDGLTRAVYLFAGSDEEAVARAREAWKVHKAGGHAVSYWQQDERGRWIDRAKAGTAT